MSVNVELEKFTSICSAIANTEQQLKELKEDRKKQQEEIRVAISNQLLLYHVGEGKAWLHTLYWSDPEIAGSINKAYGDTFGGKFTPVVTMKEIRCRRCKEEIIAPCKSWADYKSKLSWHGYVCDTCEVAMQQARRADIDSIFNRQNVVFETSLANMLVVKYVIPMG